MARKSTRYDSWESISYKQIVPETPRETQQKKSKYLYCIHKALLVPQSWS